MQLSCSAVEEGAPRKKKAGMLDSKKLSEPTHRNYSDGLFHSKTTLSVETPLRSLRSGATLLLAQTAAKKS